MSRQIWNIPGGVHPPENKKQSQKSIVKGPLPKLLVVPLQQHIGAPAKAIVAVGERVLKGQILGEANGFVSLPIHAPSSGTVIAIEQRPVQHPSQIDGLCIVIETDGKDEWAELNAAPNYQSLDRKEVLQRIRDAGIAGMGGAGFPSNIKLGLRPEAKIEQLILNAVECEPYITADDMLIRERASEIIKGLEIMAWLIQPTEILIGIEDNKPQAAEALQRAVEGTKIEVVVIPTKYPSGGEKQLIQILTSKEVRSGGLPADVGVVCQNTGTAYAIAQAIHKGEPLISRITTLSGEAVGSKGNYEVLLGTPITDLLAFTETHLAKTHRLIMGGPMMGFSIHDVAVPVVKTTNCILAVTDKELPDPAQEQPCIRCGSCAQACPASLLPQQLYWFSKSKEFDKAANYNLFDCIECGACAYVCPSNIPLVQYYRFSKGQIKIQEEEARKADHARERFEFRQQRLEQEEREKEEKRKARAEAAAKKQAEKKAAPKAPPASASTVPGAGNIAANGADDQLTKLKTASASAVKRWKDAEKALKTAEANGSEHLEALGKKVAQLKEKADKAKAAFLEAKSNPQTPVATESESPAAADPLAALKKASADDFQAYKAAEKELAEAESTSNIGSAEIEALSKKVADLKAISDASKKAMKEARAKEKEDIQNAKAAADPLKQLKIDAAIANKNAQKAAKALALAELALKEEATAENTEQVSTLKAALTEAEAKAVTANKALTQGQEA